MKLQLRQLILYFGKVHFELKPDEERTLSLAVCRPLSQCKCKLTLNYNHKTRDFNDQILLLYRVLTKNYI